MKILDESSRSQIHGVILNRMTPLAGLQILAFMLVASPNVKVWVKILPSNVCAMGNLDVGALRDFLELGVSTTPPSVTRLRSQIPANSNMISSACSIFYSFNKPQCCLTVLPLLHQSSLGLLVCHNRGFLESGQFFMLCQ